MEGLPAVVHRFPARAQAIRQLALADESFRALCADFAAAEAALRRFSEAPSASEDRCNEYEALVDELLAEVGEALDAYDSRVEPCESAFSSRA